MALVSNAVSAASYIGKFTVECDTSSSSSDEDVVDCHEFVIQCRDNEKVFVTSSQSSAASQRCPRLRNQLSVLTQDGSERVLNKPSWSIAVVRRIIEILYNGSTWIANDATTFSELALVAKELAIDVRLCSLINCHDLLDGPRSEQFFNMLKSERYQFRIHGVVKSSQWFQLLNRNVLLMTKTKVLPVKMANVKNTSQPSAERLAKCDSFCSEFCVYADGNMQALLTLSHVLSGSPHQQASSQEEQVKLVFKRRIGSVTKEEMDTIWRMMDTSFVTATAEDQAYLKSNGRVVAKGEERVQPNGVQGTKSHLFSAPRPSIDMQPESVALSTGGGQDRVAGFALGTSSPLPCPPGEYTFSTLTASSFLVLENLFEVMNVNEPNLAACLIVQSPTPDTLGRFVNATCQCGVPHLDFDVQRNIYFATKTSAEIKSMLSYMADYSSSAVIKGDFQLYQKI